MHSSGSTQHLDDSDAEFPGPGKHNIVKSHSHGGECLKCGLLGSWQWIKSQECSWKPPTPKVCVPAEPSGGASDGPSDPSSLLSAELDAALQAGDNETAQELMTLMELEQQHDKLEDEELALQIMEQELQMLELSEQLQQLELQTLKEQEDIQTFYAMKVSEKEVASVARPPATPLASKTPAPCVEKPATKVPAICI